MTDEIKVHVIDYGPGRNLRMRYLCPQTNEHIARSTSTRNKTTAERAAAKWESELRDGRYAKQSRMTWEDFRTYDVLNAIGVLANNSIVAYESTLNAFERLCSPQKLRCWTLLRRTLNPPIQSRTLPPSWKSVPTAVSSSTTTTTAVASTLPVALQGCHSTMCSEGLSHRRLDCPS